MKKPGKKSVSKTVKKAKAPTVKRRKPVARKKNPVPKINRYAIRVETPRGVQGYFSNWHPKDGPIFFTEVSKAVKGTDRKVMEQFANAIAEYKPKGIASVEVVIVGAPPVKKN